MRAPREVVDDWSTFVENGAGYEDQVADEIEARLVDSEIPGASIDRRDRVIVLRLAGLPDYRQEVRVREYGAHLELEHRAILGPGLVKQGLALLTSGDPHAWSRPRRRRAAERLEASIAAVRHQVAEAARELAGRMGPGGSRQVDLDEALGNW